MIDTSKVALVIPVLNAEDFLHLLRPAIAKQSFMPQHFLVIDSSSSDNSVSIFREMGAEVKIIDKKDFNHGGTRQMAVDMLPEEVEIVIMITQDAIPASEDAFANIVKVFEDEKVVSCFGRQLPRIGAGVIEGFARGFNYPENSYKRGKEDIAKYGIKACFNSNSFSAYRRSVLKELGGFPSDVILSEDMVVAARAVLSGYYHAYAADALVNHSHDYSFKQEFKRYFDLGVFQIRENWIIANFGRAEGEGLRVVKAELSYLLKNHPHLIFESIIRTGLKYLGFKLGMFEKHIPLNLKRKLSMHHRYWV